MILFSVSTDRSKMHLQDIYSEISFCVYFIIVVYSSFIALLFKNNK